MAEEKRYFWLKLYDDFFTSKRIKKLRKIAGGDTYVIIYLKMQLMAMKHGGTLKWSGLEEKFADELALDLDEDPANVEVALQYLLSCGLAEASSDLTEVFLPYAVKMWAARALQPSECGTIGHGKARLCLRRSVTMLQHRAKSVTESQR